MPDGGGHGPGRIGPNAIWQLLPLLERVGGAELRDSFLAGAGIFHIPTGAGLVDEAPVARLHRQVRDGMPDLAEAILTEAGRRTADYILANRIPKLAQWVLKALPSPLSGHVLAGAIDRNAWTFAGSGQFRVVSTRPLVFEVADNPLIRGERNAKPLCHWHRAVFERLFRALVSSRAEVAETACGACGAPACRFEISLGPTDGRARGRGA
jgi:divinyl protochlorophyllide a 8-vinyl-reductase